STALVPNRRASQAASRTRAPRRCRPGSGTGSPTSDSLCAPRAGGGLPGPGQLEKDPGLPAVGAVGQGPVHGRAVQLVGPVLAELPRLRRQPSPPSPLQCWTGRALPANRKPRPPPRRPRARGTPAPSTPTIPPFAAPVLDGSSLARKPEA